MKTLAERVSDLENENNNLKRTIKRNDYNYWTMFILYWALLLAVVIFVK